MLELLTDFVAELRAAGLPVSMRETLDAADALRAVDLSRRADVRAALGATLVKSAEHWPVFVTVFDVFFARRATASVSFEHGGHDAALAGGSDAAHLGGVPARLDPESIAELVRAALEAGDEASLAALAQLAVRAFAKVEPGRPVGVSYYLYRTVRALDLDAVVTALGAPGQRGAHGIALGAIEDLDVLGALGERFVAEEYAARAERLRALIEEEIRRELVAERGASAVAASLRRPLVAEVDFMHATGAELLAMRRAIFPLTRALAARLARRRRHRRRGPLDMRATIRHSLGSGGVPFEIRFRPPHPAKPEIVLIADVSGSVAAFARFTLHLVYAIGAQFSRVRSFVFVDGIDEVTEIFEHSSSVTEALQRVGAEASVIEGEGHSNYGNVFAAFRERYGHDIGPRTNVIVLGDARNNYHASGADDLAEIGRRARRLYWLNPEPRGYWGSGDSIVEEYAPHVDGVYECRNLRQLERFVEQLT